MASKEITLKALNALNIENAFTWEGSARTYLLKDFNENDKTFFVKVLGSSEVEHDGDIDGIRDQVHELKGKIVTIENFEFTINTASFEYVHDEEDYETINIKGSLIINVKSV